jgi:hypothetical protein
MSIGESGMWQPTRAARTSGSSNRIASWNHWADVHAYWSVLDRQRISSSRSRPPHLGRPLRTTQPHSPHSRSLGGVHTLRREALQGAFSRAKSDSVGCPTVPCLRPAAWPTSGITGRVGGFDLIINSRPSSLVPELNRLQHCTEPIEELRGINF